jgi:opacity protein-like surface antigen
MATLHRTIIAGVALLVASATGTIAADLYGGKGIKEAYMAGPSASWYVRGDFGYAWMDAGDLVMPSFTFGSVDVDNTWSVGGGVGHYFGRGVRGDVTYEWRGSADVTATGPITAFDLKTSVLLANLYYDFRPGERFTPYVGVGVGAAHHDTSGGSIVFTCGVCNFDGEKKWTPAGALMAGFSLRLDRHHAPVSIKDSGYDAPQPGRLHLDVGYRFLYLGDADGGHIVGALVPTPGPRLEDITAHEIRVGLRWDIR